MRSAKPSPPTTSAANRRSYGITASTLAEHHLESGRYTAAAQQAADAITIWRELEGADPYLGVDAHKNLGLARAALGRPADAVEPLHTALRIADDTGYTPGRRPLLAALARAHRDAGEPILSIGYFEEALATAEDPREPPTDATVQRTLQRELDAVLEQVTASPTRH